MLNLLSLLIGLVALVLGIVPFLPFFAWGYWFVIPIAVVGAVLLGIAAVGTFNGDGFDRLFAMVLGVGAFGLGAVGAVMLFTALRRRD